MELSLKYKQWLRALCYCVAELLDRDVRQTDRHTHQSLNCFYTGNCVTRKPVWAPVVCVTSCWHYHWGLCQPSAEQADDASPTAEVHQHLAPQRSAVTENNLPVRLCAAFIRQHLQVKLLCDPQRSKSRAADQCYSSTSLETPQWQFSISFRDLRCWGEI